MRERKRSGVDGCRGDKGKRGGVAQEKGNEGSDKGSRVKGGWVERGDMERERGEGAKRKRTEGEGWWMGVEEIREGLHKGRGLRERLGTWNWENDSTREESKMSD